MEKVWKCPSVRQGKVMGLEERVERWEKDRVYSDADPLMIFLRDLIADWKRLKADNERLRHLFSLQALDDVE